MTTESMSVKPIVLVSAGMCLIATSKSSVSGIECVDVDQDWANYDPLMHFNWPAIAFDLVQ